MSKQIQTPTDVVRCEWSGNRANAFDTDGNKRTSEITVGARQKAADCLLYTSPSPRDQRGSRMPSSA